MNSIVKLTDSPAFDAASLRRHFPILTRVVNGHPLAYLDNAASAQRPLGVIEALDGLPIKPQVRADELLGRDGGVQGFPHEPGGGVELVLAAADVPHRLGKAVGPVGRLAASATEEKGKEECRRREAPTAACIGSRKK